MWDIFSDFIARFGKSALPESLVELLHFVGPESEVELVQLPTEGWQPNVEVVRYFAGDQSDPGLKWGKHGTPDLAFFDEQGRFLGPDPVWMPGTYSPASVTLHRTAHLDKLSTMISGEEVLEEVRCRHRGAEANRRPHL